MQAAKWLEAFASGGPDKRAALAEREDAPAEGLLLALADRSKNVRFTAAINPALNEAGIAAAIENDVRGVRENIFGCSWLPLTHARRGLTDPAVSVRASLAENTPHDALIDALMQDAPRVRGALTVNPKFTGERLEALSRDTSADVRAAVARCGHAPLEMLSRLAEDRSVRVRLALLQWRLAVPTSVLRQLLDDPDAEVRGSAAERLRGQP